MRTLLLSMVLVLASAAQAQELLTQERWPDGTLRATRYKEGGRIHFITFHENGRVKEMGTFHHGRRDGVWKQYSDTGALLAQAGFRDGTCQGVWEFRTTEDQPLGRLTYIDGVLAHGEQFNTVGELVAQRDYP